MTAVNLNPDVAPLHEGTDGVIRVAGTRVTLDSIVGAFAEGATAEEIAQQYPSVSIPDVYAVISFYLRHHSEVEAYLHQRRTEAEKVRSETESRSEYAAFRQRLLARTGSSGTP